jgi:hemerythrin-like metal-binding protein
VKHFHEEELLMEAQKYPRRAQHKQAHDHFIQELLAMKSAFAATGETMSLSTLVHSFMMTWLRQHILVMDQELAGHLNKPAEKSAPRAAKKKKAGGKKSSATKRS